MALTGQIIVTTEQLRTQASTVRTDLRTMQSQFDKLKGLINGSANYWIGEAGNAHRKQYTSRITRIEEMFKKYQEQVKDLEEMAGVYEAAEAAAANAANSLPASTLD
ncbi:hypothetical protein GPK60_00095 [Ruminococcus sp. MCC718]|uniref:WXG100 family type VII secretion target n=1 Tax=Ruminococcus sp. MCC718 TaxID=2592649 RepID=UPI001C01B751|nr:WXG100 family type VII secretion target [Ruminococcus sp. MCC718]MBT9651482.1 hypothetical protein [Ruminococcus sp. MCC718]